MRNFLVYLLVILAFGCKSVEPFNASLERPVPAEKLQRDVRHAFRKLKKYQPALYWYISEEQLKRKFDSLRESIKLPQKRYDFYTALAPVVGSVRQGHLQIVAPMKRLSKKQQKALQNKGKGPFSQFEFQSLNKEIYIIKNKSKDSSIAIGTRVLEINGEKVEDLYRRYTKLYSSDGFNQTFTDERFGVVFPSYYTAQFGIQDSVCYKFSFRDSVFTKWIRRESKKMDTISKNIPKLSRKEAKAIRKKKQQKNSYFGYNSTSEHFNREYEILKTDSTTAVLRIRGFSIGSYYSFYNDAFLSMKQKKIKNLILDLRDNPGGRLSEISYLYKFLTDKQFVFAKPTEVTGKTSLLRADYFSGGNVFSKALRFVAAPIYMAYTLIKVKEDSSGRYFYYGAEHRQLGPHPNYFKGDVYVLINGGSFSASCILSSNLKSTKRAIFIGQETGGAYNGTVAGRMPSLRLPNSKLQLRVGLMKIVPFHNDGVEGRGIFPDIETRITPNDLIMGRDVEIEKALEVIHNKRQ